MDQTDQAMTYLEKAVAVDPKALDLFREIMMEEDEPNEGANTPTDSPS